jgi:FkbM family methyltransferase
MQEGDVVHAGTFCGDFLPALSRACHPTGSTIWTFEPNVENYRCASITVDINGLEGVQLYNTALGERSTCMSMRVADGNGKALGDGSRMLQGKSDEPGTGTGVAAVSVVALDDVIPVDRHVSIIHLDVEGFEPQALMGAKQTIERCRPVLVLETVPDKLWLKEAFPRLDYRVTRPVDLNMVLTCDAPSDTRSRL